MSSIAALLGGDVKSSLPPELAALEDKVQFTPEAHHRTFCEKHGQSLGLSCALCDAFFPDVVKAREIGAASISKDYIPLKDVQAYIEKAVKAAMDERSQFDAWKNSQDGQQAAKEAATADAPVKRLKAATVALSGAQKNTDLTSDVPEAKAAAEQALLRAQEEFSAALEAASD